MHMANKAISTFLSSTEEIGPNRKFLFNFFIIFANNKEEPGLKAQSTSILNP